jgi:hypothetical protein
LPEEETHAEARRHGGRGGRDEEITRRHRDTKNTKEEKKTNEKLKMKSEE